MNFMRPDLSPRSDEDVKRRNAELALRPCRLRTDQALNLATNWLRKIGVDVERLQSTCKCTIVQWKYYPRVFTDGKLEPLNREPVLLPVFQLQWKGRLVMGHRDLPEQTIVSITRLPPAGVECVDPTRAHPPRRLRTTDFKGGFRRRLTLGEPAAVI